MYDVDWHTVCVGNIVFPPHRHLIATCFWQAGCKCCRIVALVCVFVVAEVGVVEVPTGSRKPRARIAHPSRVGIVDNQLNRRYSDREDLGLASVGIGSAGEVGKAAHEKLYIHCAFDKVAVKAIIVSGAASHCRRATNQCCSAHTRATE